MKKFLFLLLMFCALHGFSQLQPKANLVIKDATTVFGINVPVGYTVYDYTNNKYYVCKTSTAGTGTLTTASANFEWINKGGTVTGTGASGQVSFWNGTSSLTGDNGLFWDNANKRLGIGTTGPTSKLEINDVNKTVLDLYRYNNFAINTTDTFAIDKGGTLSLGGKYSTASTIYGFGAIKGAKEDATDGLINGYISLITSKAGIGSREWVRITSTGTVGFGTPNPTARLDFGQSGSNTSVIQTYTSGNIKQGISNDGYGMRIFYPSSALGNLAFGTVSTTDGTTWSEKVRIDNQGIIKIASLTASKLVFTDASKNLTSTGIGTSAQFLMANGSIKDTIMQKHIPAGTTSQYWRGDKTWQTLPTTVASWTTKRKLFGRYIDGSVNMDSTIVDTYIASAAKWNGIEATVRRDSTNWNTAYSNRITSLTTTGTSGAATLVSNTLNIPQYQAAGNYQPLATVLTNIQDSINNRYRRQDTATVILSRLRAGHDYQQKGNYLTSAITSLGGLTGATQTFAIGTTGTAPTWSSTGTTHTLNIPMAASSGVTAGLVSNATLAALIAKAPIDSMLFQHTPQNVTKYRGASVGDDFLLTGSFIGGPQIGLSAGSHLFWSPKAAAFRAGRVTGQQWKNDSIGNYSFASGYNPKASFDCAVAFGENTVAASSAAFASGTNTIANGMYSHASNYSSYANAFASTAFGHFNVGGGTSDQIIDTDPLFEIGNGTASNARNSAFRMLRNGYSTFSDTVKAKAFVKTSGTAAQFLMANGSVRDTVYAPRAIARLISDTTRNIGSATVYDVSLKQNTISVKSSTGNKTYYPLFSNSSSGQIDSVIVKTDKLTFNPSTGNLKADVFQLSDRRYKNHIRPLDSSDYAKIAQIEFRKFYMNDDQTNTQHFGVVAQQVEDIGLKQFVDSSNPNEKIVNYRELSISLLAQQAEEIRLLKEQNKLLEKRISKLERKNHWKTQQMIIP